MNIKSSIAYDDPKLFHRSTSQKTVFFLSLFVSSKYITQFKLI